MEGQDHKSRRRCKGDEGTAVVELALVIVPLCLILFGIIVYGYLMSFRQNMTQAADEGARAGAVALRDTNYDTARAVATTATDKALGAFDQSCNNGKMSCSVVVHPADPTSTVPYMTVTVTYAYRDHPLLPDIPIVSGFLPRNFVSSSSAQLNS